MTPSFGWGAGLKLHVELCESNWSLQRQRRIPETRRARDRRQSSSPPEFIARDCYLGIRTQFFIAPLGFPLLALTVVILAFSTVRVQTGERGTELSRDDETRTFPPQWIAGLFSA